MSVRQTPVSLPLSAADLRYLKLDQIPPQKMTGIQDGVLSLEVGVVHSRVITQFTYFV